MVLTIYFRIMKRILLIGGGGYVGSVLSEDLINNGYFVTVYDLFIFGKDKLINHKNLKKIEGDVRNIDLLSQVINGHDCIIHLACISNDPSFELNPSLGKSINFDYFEDLIKISKQKQIKKFIYASSSSVYGIKNTENVTEDMSLSPLTDYSKFKSECEKIVLNYSDEMFVGTILRPATVCGYSKRQRLDVIVNILTNHAYNKNSIKIFGGNQKRPNIHIKDMSRAYIQILKSRDELIKNQIFNVGFENHNVDLLGELVKSSFKNKIIIEKFSSDDNRSYHISSKKIKKQLNFEPKFKIEDAIKDLIYAFENDLLPNSMSNPIYFNIDQLKKINLK